MSDIVIAMAPLEGVTTHIFRKVFKKYYKGIDVFYTPFLSANHTHKFKTREKKEYLPYDSQLIPQLITNSTDDFMWGCNVLKDAGYKEVNLNAGCPSNTVFSKRKGAGMLFDTYEYERFLDDIFNEKAAHDLPDISIKTRIGVYDKEEAKELAKIYAKYPIKELIIHPRLKKDFYKNNVDLDAFEIMCKTLNAGKYNTKIMYNGDITDTDMAHLILERFVDINRIMIGRGLVADPELAEKIKGISDGDKNRLLSFHNDLIIEYTGELSGERDVLFKMKELWAYMGVNYKKYEKCLKTIRKTKSLKEYEAAAGYILES